MSWIYYSPTGVSAQVTDVGWSTLTESRETVGGRQLELLLRARSSSTGTLVLPHNRERDTERSAARRLVLRGLLGEPWRLGSKRSGWLYTYKLTSRGATAWLRVKA